MILQNTRAFAHFLLKWIMDKPKGKWQAVAHVWDRLIVGLGGLLLTITAFITNQTGVLIIIIWSLFMLVFALWLISRSK